jgi:hypothetical protein
MQANHSNTPAPSQPVARFDRSALPVPRSFYEREGFRLARPNSKGWAMAQGQPPCHKSKSGKSFSVHLDSGGFFCHGCKTGGGDLVDYIRLRDHVDFKTAAQSLGALLEVTPEGCKRINKARRERERTQAAAAAEKEEERHERIEAREHLHAVETLYQEACDEHDWYLMSELLPRIRQAETRYWQAAGFEVRHER